MAGNKQLTKDLMDHQIQSLWQVTVSVDNYLIYPRWAKISQF